MSDSKSSNSNNKKKKKIKISKISSQEINTIRIFPIDGIALSFLNSNDFKPRNFAKPTKSHLRL